MGDDKNSELTETFDAPEHLDRKLSERIDVDQKTTHFQTFADVRIRRIGLDLLDLDRTLLSDELLDEDEQTEEKKKVHLEIKKIVVFGPMHRNGRKSNRCIEEKNILENKIAITVLTFTRIDMTEN